MQKRTGIVVASIVVAAVFVSVFLGQSWLVEWQWASQQQPPALGASSLVVFLSKILPLLQWQGQKAHVGFLVEQSDELSFVLLELLYSPGPGGFSAKQASFVWDAALCNHRAYARQQKYSHVQFSGAYPEGGLQTYTNPIPNEVYDMINLRAQVLAHLIAWMAKQHQPMWVL